MLVTIPTQLPSLSLFVDVAWLPTANARVNPFTEYSTSAIGGPIRANLPSISAGALYQVVTQRQTHGWFDFSPYVAALLSQAARPDARSDYTYKLDLGATATAGTRATEAARSWLQHVRIAATLDWVTTGLPHAGDDLPKGERVFLDDARGLSLSLGLILPVAPLP
ncbi:MAG: hypothetical protein ABR537_02825 [Gemmatimonadales bacterium]